MLAASAIRRSASCIPSPLSSAPRSCPSCAATRCLSAAFSACSPAMRELRTAAALLLSAPSSSLETNCAPASGERGEDGSLPTSWPAHAPPISDGGAHAPGAPKLGAPVPLRVTAGPRLPLGLEVPDPRPGSGLQRPGGCSEGTTAAMRASS